METKEALTLFGAYKNIHEMLQDRGYAVDIRVLGMTFQQFREKFGQCPNRKQMTILASKKKEADTILVVFASDPKVGVNPIKELVSLMTEHGANDAILIVHTGYTPAAVGAIKQIPSPLFVQIFKESEMIVLNDCVHHVLQPQFVILDSPQKEDLLQHYGIKEIHLPIMLQTDPVARYYGYKKGQVVKIIRKSETAGRYVFFRCVR